MALDELLEFWEQWHFGVIDISGTVLIEPHVDGSHAECPFCQWVEFTEEL